MFSACHRFSWLNSQPDFLPYRLDETGHFPRPARRNAYCNLSPGGLAAEKCWSGPHFRGGPDKERASHQLLQCTSGFVRGSDRDQEKEKSSELALAAPWLGTPPRGTSPTDPKPCPLLIERVKSQDAGFRVRTHPGWVDPHDRILLGTKGTYTGLVKDQRLGQDRITDVKPRPDRSDTSRE